MIKAVIFDCFGVLTSSSWQEFWSSLPSVDQQQQARMLNRSYDMGVVSREDFLSQLQAVTKRSRQEIETVLFGKPEQKNKKLLDYIRTKLKPNYKVGILSNVATDWIKKELLNGEEQALFDDIALSFEMQITKPDPRVFRLAAERLGLATSECVLVDDIGHYCDAAKAEGMQAVLYQNFEQMRQELEKIIK